MSLTYSKEYRPDIEGVRTLGAILVAVFHIWVGGVSGGVDVFFVISGYFMATGILSQYEKGKNISVVEHYQRFLLKIAPQAVVVLGILLLFSFFVINPISFLSLLNDITASAAYMQNWQLIDVGQNYLSRTESLNLLQHFWAIAIIGQVYFIWPLLVKLAEIIGKYSSLSNERSLFFVVIFLTVGSFAWALYSVDRHSQSAYFNSFARYWQFGVGSIVGLLPLLRNKLNRYLADALSFVGLFLLLTCGYLIGKSDQFAGVASIWPVAAAVLIIIAGNSKSPTNAGRLMSAKPFLWLAPLSFGIYLWHWPLFAIYMEHSRGHSPSLLAGSAILFTSIVIAKILKASIDAFLLSGQIKIGSKTTSVIVLLSICSIYLGALLFDKLAWKYRDQIEILVSKRQAIGIEQGVFTVRNDIPDVYSNGCHQDIQSSEVTECIVNEGGTKGVIVLVGGSHVTHWLPAMKKIAINKKWQLISLTKSACIFSDISDKAMFDDKDPSCKEWNKKVYERILQIKPDMVFTILTRVKSSVQGVEETVPRGYGDIFTKLADNGVQVFAMRDNPWMGHDIPSCWFSPWRTNANDCARLRKTVLNDVQYNDELKSLDPRVRVIDMTDQFCDETLCHVLSDTVLIYRDSHHITATYAELIAGKLQVKLER